MNMSGTTMIRLRILRLCWLPTCSCVALKLVSSTSISDIITCQSFSRDVGECSGLDANSVNWITSNFPGLDSSGCGAFEISNISFVSLNAVALLCGNNKLLFDVEKVIERESVDLQMEIKGTDEAKNESAMFRELSYGFSWRENAMTSGSGPVLLLHFPLYQSGNSYKREVSTFKSTIDPSGHDPASAESRGFLGTGPYGLSQTVPPNATEYIFHALKPRIIFSAHTHEFSDHTHLDGTREVTVPAMSWTVRDDPGFIIATFRGNRSTSLVTISEIDINLIGFGFLVIWSLGC